MVGPDFGGIKVSIEDDFAMSNSSHGIVSLHTGDLFATSSGWARFHVVQVAEKEIAHAILIRLKGVRVVQF